jgi:hypothetical protein
VVDAGRGGGKKREVFELRRRDAALDIHTGKLRISGTLKTQRKLNISVRISVLLKL